ncbi:MAG TPA: ABC transporter substrate-binding protein [Armatimonadota bacterium]|nr:ABC transporter substrate-binding protein [Armatimonadota bacterium]
MSSRVSVDSPARRWAAAGGVAVLLLGIWWAAPGRRAQARRTASGVPELHVWSGWMGHERDAFEEIVAAFNVEHPHVRLVNTSTAQDDSKVFRAIVSGAPPDVFFIWNSEYVGALAQHGALRPLDDLMARTGPLAEDILAGGLAQCRYEGRMYALPYLVDAYALFWNKGLFREAGLDPERPPKTLEELLEVAARLTVVGPDGGLTRMGMAPFALHHVCALMGGSLYDADHHRVTADSAENVRALEWLCALVERQGGSAQVDAFSAGFGEYASSQQEYFAGKVAMVESGQWWPSFTERFAREMDYGVCALPYPADRPDLRNTVPFGGNFACIPAGSRHPDLAWEFLAWTQTRVAQAHFARVMHGVPNLKQFLELPELTTGSRENEAFGVVCSLAGGPNGRAFPVTPANTLFSRELELAVDFATHGTKTPAQAMHDVTVRVQREIDQILEAGR